MATSQKIVEELGKRKSLSARDLAEATGIPAEQISDALNRELRGKVQQDRNYRWSLRQTHSIGTAQTRNTPLRKLCAYYLDCLSYDAKGISSPLWTRNDQYIELDRLPNHEDANSCSSLKSLWAAHLYAKQEESQGEYTLRIGYPCFVQWVPGRNYGFVEPLLTWPVARSEQTGNLLPVLAKEAPTLNFKAIRSVCQAQASELMEETIWLANELGLDGVALREPGEIAQRLERLRPDWLWKEPIDPIKLGTRSAMDNIRERGIYNRAVLIRAAKSKYTEGLETELRSLQEKKPDDYKKSALACLLESWPEAASEASNRIFEVLPFNSEQRDAIRAALTRRLTVITGPPGTGKSQVVVGILTNLAWQGKTVLFASKNNKAVDVVVSRMNDLAPRPIMVRLGRKSEEDEGAKQPNEKEELARYMDNLLSLMPNEEHNERLQGLSRELETKHERIERENQNIRAYIELRNAVDEAEKGVEELRRELGEARFQGLRKVTPQRNLAAWTPLNQLIRNATNAQQRWWIRLLWKWQWPKRKAGLENWKTLQEHVCQTAQVEVPPAEEINLPEWQGLEQNLAALQPGIEQIHEYFAQLQKLASRPPIEKLGLDLDELENQLQKLSREYWQLWLLVSPTKMSQQEREWIAEFRTACESLARSSQPETGVMRKYYQLLPKIGKQLPCWSVTCLSARGRLPFNAGVFDYVVLDEASQCDIASALPLLYRAKNAIIIGDPKQLRHITSLPTRKNQELLEKHGITELNLAWSYCENSLYDLAASRTKPGEIRQLLDHHRCHADIVEYSNAEFYQGALRIATAYDRLKLPKDGQAIRWIDVPGEMCYQGGTSNPKEAEAVAEEIDRLLTSQKYEGTVGVATPFRTQGKLITELVEKRLNAESLTKAEFIGATAHKFQGDERDVMIFAPVISAGARDSSLHFLREQPNLFNVAVTRARACLIVVGDRRMAKESNIPYLRAFEAHVTRREEQARQLAKRMEKPRDGKYPETDDWAIVSEWEKTLFYALWKAGLETIPQYPVEKYQLDLAYLAGEQKLDIEVDGEHYHKKWNGEVRQRDHLRNKRLKELGWDVQRFWVYELRDDLEGCVARIRTWAQQTGLEIGQRPG